MHILFFAKLREDVGMDACSVSLNELGLSGACSANQIILALQLNNHLSCLEGANFSVLGAHLSSDQHAQAGPKLLASVDHELVEDFNFSCINDDSELAFFPPVTGG